MNRLRRKLSVTSARRAEIIAAKLQERHVRLGLTSPPFRAKHTSRPRTCLQENNATTMRKARTKRSLRNSERCASTNRKTDVADRFRAEALLQFSQDFGL